MYTRGLKKVKQIIFHYLNYKINKYDKYNYRK